MTAILRPSPNGRTGTRPLKGIFTDYVRYLEPGGETPDTERFTELWNTLRIALRSELTKRGLWQVPPDYVGIHGWGNWHSPGDPGGGSEGALEELLADCYGFIFVARLRSLKEHLKVKDNIDGLVFLNIRSFLLERQKEHDPLGFRVFQLLRSALREAVAAGELRVLEGDVKISNATVLGHTDEAVAAKTADLEAVARRWNDELLPELLTARGKGRPAMVEKLRRRLCRLNEEGISAFRFKDLVDPLKNDVRTRWAAIAARDAREVPWEEGLAQVVRLARPDTGVEDRDSFRKLTACVAHRLEHCEAPDRTRRHLRDLWELLYSHAAGSSEKEKTRTDGPPSRRKIAEELRIPRQRLPELFATLGEWIRECQQSQRGKPTVTEKRRLTLAGQPDRSDR